MQGWCTCIRTWIVLLLTLNILLFLDLGSLGKIHLHKLYLDCNILMLTELKRALLMRSFMKKTDKSEFWKEWLHVFLVLLSVVKSHLKCDPSKNEIKVDESVSAHSSGVKRRWWFQWLRAQSKSSAKEAGNVSASQTRPSDAEISCI